ncbi:MAG: type II toxin-antitoxin system RelE/ParE family toxin [Alphaproteobacteria bacterium]|nr:type II toxin-antitoxin system RelE/ParE family toxin [Alphaproteobacteria bacterium]
MAYRVEITPSAQRALRKIEPTWRNKISHAIDSLVLAPRPYGCVKLAGLPDKWRIRVGDYRVIYSITDNILLVVVVGVGHRREIYR